MNESQQAAAAGRPYGIRLYLAVFGALLALTLLTVAVSYWHLPPKAAIPAGLLIAAVKAGLVVAFFMHLKGEHRLVYACLGIMLFCLIGFLLVPADLHLLRQYVIHSPVGVQPLGPHPEAQ